MDCQRHHTKSEQREADFATRGEANQCEETVVATGHQMQDLAAGDDLTETFCAIARRNVKELNRATRLVIYMSASIVRFASVSLDLLSGKIGLLGLRAAGHRLIWILVSLASPVSLEPSSSTTMASR